MSKEKKLQILKLKSEAANCERIASIAEDPIASALKAEAKRLGILINNLETEADNE